MGHYLEPCWNQASPGAMPVVSVQNSPETQTRKGQAEGKLLGHSQPQARRAFPLKCASSGHGRRSVLYLFCLSYLFYLFYVFYVFYLFYLSYVFYLLYVLYLCYLPYVSYLFYVSYVSYLFYVFYLFYLFYVLYLCYLSYLF